MVLSVSVSEIHNLCGRRVVLVLSMMKLCIPNRVRVDVMYASRVHGPNLTWVATRYPLTLIFSECILTKPLSEMGLYFQIAQVASSYRTEVKGSSNVRHRASESAKIRKIHYSFVALSYPHNVAS